MTERIRAALAALDRIVARWPRLRTADAQARLAKVLDASEGSDDSGNRDGQRQQDGQVTDIGFWKEVV